MAALYPPLIHFVGNGDDRWPHLVGESAVAAPVIVLAIVAIDIAVFILADHLAAFLTVG